MILDLTEIESDPRPFEFVVPAADLDFDDDRFKLAGDVNVVGSVTRHSAEIEVDGAIVGTAEIECTRCLRSVHWKIDIEFLVSFVTPDNFIAAKEREVSAADLATDVLTGDRIEVKEIVREQILLNVPEHILCGPECKGLCPQCGADLNLLDCKCDLKEIDPRWSALKDIR